MKPVHSACVTQPAQANPRHTNTISSEANPPTILKKNSPDPLLPKLWVMNCLKETHKKRE